MAGYKFPGITKPTPAPRARGDRKVLPESGGGDHAAAGGRDRAGALGMAAVLDLQLHEVLDVVIRLYGTKTLRAITSAEVKQFLDGPRTRPAT